MNTDSGRHTAYKIWLNELHTVPVDVFSLTFKQFLDLLITENPDKAKDHLQQAKTIIDASPELKLRLGQWEKLAQTFH